MINLHFRGSHRRANVGRNREIFQMCAALADKGKIGRMFTRILFLLSVFCLLLSACSPTPAPVPTETAIPSLTPDAVALDTATPDTPSATPIPTPTRPQYTMDVQFNYANKSAIVNETIVYTNNSTDTLTSLVLAVEPTCTQSFSLNGLVVDGITSYQLHF